MRDPLLDAAAQIWCELATVALHCDDLEDAQRQWQQLDQSRQSIEDTPLRSTERRHLLEQMS